MGTMSGNIGVIYSTQLCCCFGVDVSTERDECRGLIFGNSGMSMMVNSNDVQGNG